MKFKRGMLASIVTIGLLAAATLSSPSVQSLLPKKIITFNPTRATYTVTEVLDGDTIKIDTGEKVRYIGIDAPEQNEPMGLSAKKYNERLVLGKAVRLAFDREKTDQYGRILAYIYVGNMLVNERLLEEGYARVETFKGMRKPSLLPGLQKAEQWAKEHHNGMWLEE